MNIDTIETKIYNYELIRAKDNNFVLNPEAYAKEKTKLLLKFEGVDSLQRHVECFQSIIISSYLSMIKQKSIESVLILAIKEDVLDYYCFSSDESSISAESYFLKNADNVSAIDFINKWHNEGAHICNYHNHPLRIAAIPSNEDIKSLCRNQDNSHKITGWDSCVEKYGINVPKGFRYDDWGVVTEFDFFSYKQFIENGNCISRIKTRNTINNTRASKRLSEFKIDD